MSVVLDDVWEDWSEVADEDLEVKGREAYARLYLNQGRIGLHQDHEGGTVVFHEDRFDHAFYDKKPHRLNKRMDRPERDRLECMAWIGALLAGEVDGSECWQVPSPTGRRRPPNRLYIAWDESYVLWLEPRHDGGWKFSSAYRKTRGSIRDYCRGGGKVWSRKSKAP